MTVKEKLREMLVQKGMFESQADAVLVIAIPEIEACAPDYSVNWDGPAEGYPDVVYASMALHLYAAAKEWIAEYEPLAWYRPMFD